MQNKIKYNILLGKRNLKNNNSILPYCNLCFNKNWHPKILFSFDTGPKLVYYCDCKKSIIQIKVEKNNAK